MLIETQTESIRVEDIPNADDLTQVEVGAATGF